MDNSFESFRPARFYFVRNLEGQRAVSVALIKHEGFYFRGVAICSTLDSPNRHIGKSIAFNRAISLILQYAGVSKKRKSFDEKNPIQSKKVRGTLEKHFGEDWETLVPFKAKMERLSFDELTALEQKIVLARTTEIKDEGASNG